MKKIFLTLLLVITSMGLFAKETPEKKFWSWFKKNESKIFLSDVSYNSEVQKLSQKLSEYKDGVTYEISGEENGKKELVLSADGIKKLFPFVQALYKSAPKFERWSIIAFRPRMDDFSKVNLKYSGKEFDPTDLWIYHKIKDGFFDLIIYHPEFSEEEKNIFISGTFILLDIVLGEYDVVTGIRYIDIQKWPEDPKNKGLVPFIELRNIFDKYKNDTKH